MVGRRYRRIKRLFSSSMNPMPVVVYSICSRKRARSSDFSKVNEALHKWYLLACSKNICPVGSQLCEKAREIAERLHVSGFKASNGWMDKWKKSCNVRHVKISGECEWHYSGCVEGESTRAC